MIKKIEISGKEYLSCTICGMIVRNGFAHKCPGKVYVESRPPLGNYVMSDSLGGSPLPETLKVMEMLRKYYPAEIEKLNCWVRKDLTPKEYIRAFIHGWNIAERRDRVSYG